MSRMTYTEQLKHPKWQKRRLEILSRAEFKCEECQDEENTLHVHHLLYRKGAVAWDYSDDELRALCESCHAEWHLAEAQLKSLLPLLSTEELVRVVDLAYLLSDDYEVEVKINWPASAAG
jgi:5-methylcytosine-specific restriction endonuclease McrA